MEIYHDILDGIKKELTSGDAKPTRVQYHSNLAYDKFSSYLEELESRGMIEKKPLLVTEKGKDFLQDYERIREFVNKMGVKYLNYEEEEIHEF